MNKTKLAVALGAAVAVGVAMMGTTAASAGTPGSNSGSSVALRSGPAAAPTGDLTPFTQYLDPTAPYLKRMCYLDLAPYYGSTFSSGAMVKQMYGNRKCKKIKVTITPGGGPVWQVGVEWATWGVPPQAEIPNPYVYYTNGSTSIDVSFSKNVSKAGLEVEPNLFQEEQFTATYTGGSTNFQLNVTANGSAGSRLIGAKATGTGTSMFNNINVADNLGDFALAQVRACLKKC